MMKPSALAVAAMAACSSLAPAATLIFEDDFASGTAGWYSGGTSGTISNPVGTLSWNPTVAVAPAVIARQFAVTSLAVGETMRLSFSWTPQSGGSGITRVGLFNVARAITGDGWNAATGSGGIGGSAAGYFSFFRDDSGTANGARYESGSVSTSTDLDAGTELGSIVTQYDFASGTVYTVVFDVTLTSLTEIKTLLTVSSAGTTRMSVSGTHSGSGIVSGFNTVGIRANENTTSRFDDVKLEVIPEPSSALLAALGPVALAVRRRRQS